MANRKLSTVQPPMARLAVVQRSAAELRPDPRNPRQHSKSQIGQIARSIESFGFNVPILIDSSDQVIAGHARLLAARQLGRTEVPTICLDHLSEAQARAYLIADNRLAETSDWNDELLGEALRELSVMELEFSLEDIGFDMGEIDFRIEAGSTKAKKKPDADDRFPACDDVAAVSAMGDLWQLGRHRLFCGSALEEESYRILLDGAQAAMVFTDPPYNVPIRGHVSGLGKITHREFAMASGEMSSPAFADFLRTALDLHGRYSSDGSLHFICMDWRHMPELLAAGRDTYAELKNLCVWTKDNAGMGSLYPKPARADLCL